MTVMEGKKALVFGGTSGIGLASARMLRDAGVEVIALSRRGSIAGESEGIIVEKADVLDRESLPAIFERHQGFDFLVNAATGGERAIGPFLQMELEGFQDSFAKLWGYVNTVRLGVPHMAEDGAIVLVSGYPARKWRPGVLAIGTVGNAVEGFIRLVANEIAPVRINGVCPGLIDTPMFTMEGEARQHYMAETTKTNLVPRPGTAAEVASAVMFLMSNAFTTGTIVDVDGGAIVT